MGRLCGDIVTIGAIVIIEGGTKRILVNEGGGKDGLIGEDWRDGWF